MKSFIVLAGSAFMLAAPLGMAAMRPAWAQNSQQQRMTACNAQAGQQNLTGDARKSFMSDCLSGKTTAAKMTPQERMKSCNTQAGTKNLSGDARKSFMASCLKG
jgi:hypothetical protein